MKPVEYWMCQGCDDVHLTEESALGCHPPEHGWSCGSCGDACHSRVQAERCCTEDGGR